MGHALHQSNVMADKAYGKALLSLKFNDQFDYIFLYGYIQCCRCLIQNQDLRLEGQRPGNCYPLPLTAAHAVRVTVFKISGQLHHFQEVAAYRCPFLWGDQAKIQQRLTDNIPHPHFGIERCAGILKNHLNVPPCLPQLLSPKGRNILAPIQDLPAVRPVQRYQESHKCAFAAAGFPYKTQRFSLYQLQ